ncbi:uncharacterized protein BDV17DRAFT_300448 [Aspergillus undulatus]|uniref:uncharacterized protein n=1 Tax=Aspergillus undulatus TaxID=1810928 RepID=UPI003CCE21B8
MVYVGKLIYFFFFFYLQASGALYVHRSNSQAESWRGQLPAASTYESPRFRYWWPGGWIDPDIVSDEVQAMALAGFGGAEIGDVRDSITVPMRPKIYGWAEERWNAGVFAAYETAAELGLHMDYSLGPHWPTGVPGYTPDSVETAKELVHGQALLQAGARYFGPLPLSVADPSGQVKGNPNVTATPQLVAVLAARTTSTNVSATKIDFDQSSITSISEHYKDGNLTWTAPHDGPYIVVAVYGRGTAQIQNMYDMNPDGPQLTDPAPAYIVDHFSSAGVRATVSYWNEHILTDELRALLETSHGSLFEDSLELKLTQYWTPNFLDEFRTRRGYDLTPYLLYVLKDTNKFTGDPDIARMVEYDFFSTVTDLYIDYRLTNLKKFAQSLGLKLRVQPYTTSFDSSRAAAFVDIPEGESLAFDSAPDSFRVLATGRDVAGKTTILSNEIGAYMGKAYGVTWNFLLGTANRDTSLGATQSVIHGFPYQNSPNSVWPGFSAFTPLGPLGNGFAEAWGPRQPQWIFAPNASSYLARSQELMQSGLPSVDVAVLNLDWGVTATWDDTGLNDAGYSYQFPTPELLVQYSASVQNRRLIYDGPRYKALVLNNVTALNVESAEAVLSHARAGLPIVIFGSTPTSTQSLCTSCGDVSAHLEAVFESTLSLQNARQVTSQAQVPEALENLGVKPLIRYATSSNVSTITTRRRIADNEYIYWIYSSSTTSQTIKLEGKGFPLSINLWTGDVLPIASFHSADGYTVVNVTIGENGVAAIYLGHQNPYGVSNLKQHILATDAEAAVDEDGNLFVRAVNNGAYTARLSTRNTTTVTFENILPAVTPKSWSLTVEDWSPVADNQTGLYSSLTEKTTLPPVTLQGLKSWYNISGLEYASGVGVYQTTVNLTLDYPLGLRQSLGVYINFGVVQGSWGLELNGKTVPGIDYFVSRPLDVTPYVRSGLNDVKITVATTLWNKLRKTWPDMYGSLDPEEIGLLGPVNLTYYTQQQVL